jgi:hypothetical protein
MIVGDNAEEMLALFSAAASVPTPKIDPPQMQTGEVLLWSRKAKGPPLKVRAYPCKTERRRHRRKYAEGELPPDRSFYYRGPEAKLNLRAHNLMMFLVLGEGVDDDTWEFHRASGDYSKWLTECIKDEELANAAKQIESLPQVATAEGRHMMRDAVERGYVLISSSKMPVPGAS